jgi:hypothetical protein
VATQKRGHRKRPVYERARRFGSRPRPYAAALAAVSALLIVASSAQADVFFSNPGRGSGSGVDQYSASIPSAGGPVTPGVTNGQPVTPSSAVAAALRSSGGRDSGTLGALVTQAGLGASAVGARAGAAQPAGGSGSSGSGSGAPGSQGSAKPTPPSSVSGTPVSATQALGGASRAPLWLLAGLVLATAAALVVRLMVERPRY